MSHSLLLAIIFVAFASIGFSYVFRANEMRVGMVRICNRHQFLDLLMRKWLDESPSCIPTLRLMGVFGLLVSAVTYFALVSRLVHRTP